MKSLKTVVLSALMLMGASQVLEARPILFNPSISGGSSQMESVIDRPILFSNGPITSDRPILFTNGPITSDRPILFTNGLITSDRPILFSTSTITEVSNIDATSQVTVWGVNKKMVDVEITNNGTSVSFDLPEGNYIIQVVKADGNVYQTLVKVK
ncbi:MAG: hypothetical protein ACRC6V_13970 [Bacteroidales bacterium]